MKIAPVAVACIWGASVLCSLPVYACTCLPEGLKQQIERYPVVFLGQVVTLDVAKDPVEAIFRVVQTWKGPRAPRSTVRTNRERTACGYRFVTGRHYVVFAYQDRGGLGTSVCSPTELATDARDLIRVLDKQFGVITVVPKDR